MIVISAELPCVEQAIKNYWYVHLSPVVPYGWVSEVRMILVALLERLQAVLHLEKVSQL